MKNSKYPRTLHLPWSENIGSDDKRLSSVEYFLNKPLVITEKIDGSNLCITKDMVYARSHSGSPKHPSFDPAKFLHATIGYQIDSCLSIFGEWCFAVHSIEYDSLPGYFLVFHIRIDDLGDWADWDLVVRGARKLGLNTVPVLWEGIVTSEQELQTITDSVAHGSSTFGREEREGIVVRVRSGFSNELFSKSVAKWVRKDHPKDPDEHWMFKTIKRQGIKDE